MTDADCAVSEQLQVAENASDMLHEGRIRCGVTNKAAIDLSSLVSDEHFSRLIKGAIARFSS